MVFDSGYGISHSVPIFEGFTIPSGVEKIKISGEHLTMEMQRLLNERGTAQSIVGMRQDSAQKTFTTPTEIEQLRLMKETMTYCVENYE